MRACLLIAGLIGVLGLGLRLVVPVAPVDEAYRDVVRSYRSPEAGPSNTGETLAP